MLENIRQACQHWRKVRRFESMHKRTLLFPRKVFNFHFALKNFFLNKLLKDEKHQTRVSLLLGLVSDAYLTANRTWDL